MMTYTACQANIKMHIFNRFDTDRVELATSGAGSGCTASRLLIIMIIEIRSYKTRMNYHFKTYVPRLLIIMRLSNCQIVK